MTWGIFFTKRNKIDEETSLQTTTKCIKRKQYLVQALKSPSSNTTNVHDELGSRQTSRMARVTCVTFINVECLKVPKDLLYLCLFPKSPFGSPRMHGTRGSARDRIIVPIDASRSITLEKSIGQVADADRQQVIWTIVPLFVRLVDQIETNDPNSLKLSFDCRQKSNCTGWPLKN